MLVIGIAGGSGSGKSTFVREILSNLPKDSVSVIPQDAYYRDNSHVPMKERIKMNFDHPDSIEFPLLIKDIKKLPTVGYISI